MDINSNFKSVHAETSYRHDDEVPDPFHSFDSHSLSHLNPFLHQPYSTNNTAFNFTENEHNLSQYDNTNSSYNVSSSNRLEESNRSDFTLKQDLKSLLVSNCYSAHEVGEDIELLLSRAHKYPITNHISTNEYISLVLYCRIMFRPINTMLTKDPNELHHPVVQALNSGLKKLAQIPDNQRRKVHRGIHKQYTPEEFNEEFKQGHVFSRPHFMSTSTSQEIADEFTGSVQLHLNTHSATSIEGICGFAREEREALIPPNTPFRVMNIEKKGDIWHVDMDEILN